MAHAGRINICGASQVTVESISLHGKRWSFEVFVAVTRALVEANVEPEDAAEWIRQREMLGHGNK